MSRLSAPHPPQHGFSLVEVMVAMVIGLLGMIVIFQVFAISETQKRTTTGGSDAQTSGNIALFSIEREMRLGGYGFASTTLLNCDIQAFDEQRPSPGTFNFRLVPVEITQGAAAATGTGAPDVVSIFYSASAKVIDSRPFTKASSTNANYKVTNSQRDGYAANDLVLAVGSGGTNACVLGQVTDIPGIPGQTDVIEATPGQGRYNPGSGIDGPTGGTLYNLGASPRNPLFSIKNSDRLVVQDNINYVDTDGDGINDMLELAEGIVNLQAQYGADTDNDGVVAPAEFSDAEPATSVIWGRLRAVRIAVLARNGQFEKTAVTPVAPSWSGGTFTMTNPADGTNWQNYRYRVYETVVPLRNMIWR